MSDNYFETKHNDLTLCEEHWSDGRTFITKEGVYVEVEELFELIKDKDARIAELEDFVKSVAEARVEHEELSGRYGGTEDISFISDIYVDRAKEVLNRVDTV